MFIWLASYPKSGNTLVRSMLSSYFFSKDGIYNFDLLENIQQFPYIKLFELIGINIKNENEIIKNYIEVQKFINKKNSVQFLKTHSCLFNINGSGFTDLQNSLGVIYIVRDPRNVVISYANHMNCSISEAADDLINLNQMGDFDLRTEKTRVYTGIWSVNYNSWKSFKSIGKYLLIKYEDLVHKKEETFLKILKFIYKLKKEKFKLNEEKFNNTIKSTSFQKMKNLEKKIGFAEATTNKETGKKITFFNLGPENDWKKILPNNIILKIEKIFKKEMIELGYL
jgi:hypothetical protein